MDTCNSSDMMNTTDDEHYIVTDVNDNVNPLAMQVPGKGAANRLFQTITDISHVMMCQDSDDSSDASIDLDDLNNGYFVRKVAAKQSFSLKCESYSSEIVTKPPESPPELKENFKPELTFCIRASKPEWATRLSKTIIQTPESPLKAKENVKPEESFCIRESEPEWATRSSKTIIQTPESPLKAKENVKPEESFCIRESEPEWATRSSKTIIQTPESPLKAKENVKPEVSFCIRPSTPEWATRHFSNNTIELKTYVSSDLNLQKKPPKRRKVTPSLASNVNWDLLISMHSQGPSCLPKKLQQ